MEVELFICGSRQGLARVRIATAFQGFRICWQSLDSSGRSAFLLFTHLYGSLLFAYVSSVAPLALTKSKGLGDFCLSSLVQAYQGK